MTSTTDQWLTSSGAAALLGVSVQRVRRWADNGVLPCQITPGKHRRFERTQLEVRLGHQTKAVDEFASALNSLLQCLEADPQRHLPSTNSARTTVVLLLRELMLSDTKTRVATLRTMLLQLQDYRVACHMNDVLPGQSFPDDQQLSESSQLLLELYASSVRRSIQRG